MSTIQIVKDNAFKAYRSADNKGKKLLEDLLGKEHLSEKITDRVKTYEDACEVLGINPDAALPGNDGISEDEAAVMAFAKLSIIRKALNEGWKPNYADGSQNKYYPWFKWTAGSGFSFDDCDYDGTYTLVGARLSFRTSELAEYAGKQFIDLYRDFLTLTDSE